MVFGKEIALYAHWIGIILGLGFAIIGDAIVMRKAVLQTIDKKTIQLMHMISTIVAIGLVILILSGGFLLSYKVHANPDFMLGTKIWTKLMIVFLLTVNGALLHGLVLPAVENAHGKTLFEDKSDFAIAALLLVGCVSFVSWMCSFGLGFMKTLPFGMNVMDGIVFYLIMIVFAWIGAFLLFNIARSFGLLTLNSRKTVKAHSSGGSYGGNTSLPFTSFSDKFHPEEAKEPHNPILFKNKEENNIKQNIKVKNKPITSNTLNTKSNTPYTLHHNETAQWNALFQTEHEYTLHATKKHLIEKHEALQNSDTETIINRVRAALYEQDKREEAKASKTHTQPDHNMIAYKNIHKNAHTPLNLQ